MGSSPRYLLDRNGRYFARLVVPADLRPFLDGSDKGKTELREALGPDYRTALKRLHQAVAGIQHKIALAERRKCEAEAVPLPTAPRYEVSDEDIARCIYETRLHTDEQLRDRLAAYVTNGVSPEWQGKLRQGWSGALDDFDLHDLVGLTLDRFKTTGNTAAEFGTPEWRRLARMACLSMLEASERAVERNAGNFAGAPSNAFLMPRHEPEPRKPVSLRDLFRDYLQARAKVGRAREAGKRWAPVIEDLIKFMGHDDITRYTKAKLREWRDTKLETLSTKTVSQVYLASIRTVLKWAKENDLIDENVAQDVRQPVPKRIRTREQGYTDEEALRVLKAARGYCPTAKSGSRAREAPPMTSAKRWLPWLAAFSGARIGELAQVRRDDIRKEHGAWILRINPEAGTVKTRQYRDVPIHPQIIALGFEAYFLSCTGPLFFSNSTKRDSITASRTVSDRIGKWLRNEGLVPRGVAPNHGWRHRFKTVGLEYGIGERVLDAICGHSRGNAGDAYGDVTTKVRIEAINRLPPYELGREFKC